MCTRIDGVLHARTTNNALSSSNIIRVKIRESRENVLVFGDDSKALNESQGVPATSWTTFPNALAFGLVHWGCAIV
jgi:hypothetical protein